MRRSRCTQHLHARGVSIILLLCVMPVVPSLVPIPTQPDENPPSSPPSPPAQTHHQLGGSDLPSRTDPEILKDVVRFLADELEAPAPTKPRPDPPVDGTAGLNDTDGSSWGNLEDFGSSIAREAVHLSAAEEQVDGPEQAKRLESVLHWAISHSDPAELAERAERARRGEQLSVDELLAQKRGKVKELLDWVKTRPTEAQMTVEALSVLETRDSDDGAVLEALSALQELVEPLDNANDLRTLGGITPLARLVSPDEVRRRPEVAAAAAYVLGTAASNNIVFQQHLLEDVPGIFPLLLGMARSSNPEVAVKGLYAVASLVRNLEAARQSFHTAAGLGTLAAVLGDRSLPARVQRKAVNLMVDLLQMDPSMLTTPGDEAGALVAAAVQLLAEPDADLQEKAVGALKVLMMGPHKRVHAPLIAAGGGREALANLHASLAEAARDDPYVGHLRGQVGEALGLLNSLTWSEEL